MTTAEIIRAIVGKFKHNVITASVLAVDQSGRTCDCRPLNGDSDIFAVRIQAAINGNVGIYSMPTVGSTVMVSMMNKATGIIINCSQIDSYEIVIGSMSLKISDSGIVMNGGNNGLVNISSLVSKLNEIVTAFNSHIHVSSGVIATPVPGVIPIASIIQSTMEDNNVKH